MHGAQIATTTPLSTETGIPRIQRCITPLSGLCVAKQQPVRRSLGEGVVITHRHRISSLEGPIRTKDISRRFLVSRSSLRPTLLWPVVTRQLGRRARGSAGVLELALTLYQRIVPGPLKRDKSNEKLGCILRIYLRIPGERIGQSVAGWTIQAPLVHFRVQVP